MSFSNGLHFRKYFLSCGFSAALSLCIFVVGASLAVSAESVLECGLSEKAEDCRTYEIDSPSTPSPAAVAAPVSSGGDNEEPAPISRGGGVRPTKPKPKPAARNTTSNSEEEEDEETAPAKAAAKKAAAEKANETPAAQASNSNSNSSPEKSTSSSNSRNDSVAQEKVTAIEEAISSCKADSEKAESSCMTDKNGGMSTLITTLDAFARQMTAIPAAAGSTTETCLQMAKTAGAANASLGALKMSCSMGSDSCSTTCGKKFDEALKEIPAVDRTEYRTQVKEAKAQCSRAKSRLQGIEQNMAAAMQSYMKAQTCQSDVASGLPSLAQCVANPNVPGCGSVLPQNCANPTFAAANLACTCLATQNRDSRCASFATAAMTPNSGGTNGLDGSANGPIDSASALAASGSIGGASMDGGIGGALGAGGDGGPGGKNATSSVGAFPGQGGGGTNGHLPGHTGGSDPKAKGGARESRFSADVIKGYVGGAPGAGAALGAKPSLGSAGEGTYSKTGAWIPPKVSLNPNMINYEKFRPKSDVVIREMASQLGEATDLSNGLLAPHIDIWKKVNSRYTILRSTLTP